MAAPLWTASSTPDALDRWKLDPTVPGPAADQADAAVRCVRAGSPDGDPAPRFTVGATDGSTVIDGWTGLEWRRCADGAAFDGEGCDGTPTALPWTGATGACAESFGDHDDWFVPDLVQLGSLADYCGQDPAILGAAFPQLPSGAYWSSTNWPASLNHLCLDAELGLQGWCDIDIAQLLLCARSVD